MGRWGQRPSRYGFISRVVPDSSKGSPGLAATMFVFLAAATGAGIIAADLGPAAHWLWFGHCFLRYLAHHFAAFGLRARRWRTTEGAGFGMDCLLRHFAQKVFECEQTGCAAKDIMTDLGLDVDHELFEHGKRLGLVLDERVALSV